MATVLMKWLETSPKRYDRGIKLLTLGRVRQMHDQMVEQYIRPGVRVLDVGCGTGDLSVRMAQAGATVVGIDLSPQMLGAASSKVIAHQLQGKVSLQILDAALAPDEFPAHSFDLIVASLSFSEMSPEARRYLLGRLPALLSPGGRLVVIDETRPPGFFSRLGYALLRAPLAALTWLLTRATTHPLKDDISMFAQAGYRAEVRHRALLGSLVMMEAVPEDVPAPQRYVIRRLRHQVTFKTVLKDVLVLFNRLIPPYPKVTPGLYAVGEPDAHAPVLVTGNFDLTVRRLVKALDRQVDVWLLVVDTTGINVWCAAGGGFFTAEKVAAAIKTAGLEAVVAHHALVLPQLAAAGVDGWKLRKLSGWGVHWGPVRAVDILAYLAAGKKKTAAMRTVTFPLKDRLEMVTVTLAFYGLMILLPVFIFWRGLFWPVTAALLGLAYFYAVVHPWLPGRDGLEKTIPLTGIALLGFAGYLWLAPGMPADQIFYWALGLSGLAVFTAAEMQGMSPLMRGEQANWTIEGVVYAGLGALAWLVPLLTGWR